MLIPAAGSAVPSRRGDSPMPARGQAAQPGWWAADAPRHQPPGCAPGPEQDSGPHHAIAQ